MKRGRKPGSSKPWQEHFKRRIQFEGDHWIWTGRANSYGTGLFGARLLDRKEKYFGRSAVYFAYWFKYGVERPACRGGSVRRMCDRERCINPDHYRDGSPEKLNTNQKRDQKIRRIHKNHLRWKHWTMAAIGRKYGMSRERIRQIVKAGTE